MKLLKMRFSPYLEWVLKLKRNQIYLKGDRALLTKGICADPRATDSNFKVEPLLHMTIKLHLKSTGKNMQASKSKRERF